MRGERKEKRNIITWVVLAMAILHNDQNDAIPKKFIEAERNLHAANEEQQARIRNIRDGRVVNEKAYPLSFCEDPFLCDYLRRL